MGNETRPARKTVFKLRWAHMGLGLYAGVLAVLATALSRHADSQLTSANQIAKPLSGSTAMQYYGKTAMTTAPPHAEIFKLQGRVKERRRNNNTGLLIARTARPAEQPVEKSIEPHNQSTRQSTQVNSITPNPVSQNPVQVAPITRVYPGDSLQNREQTAKETSIDGVANIVPLPVRNPTRGSITKRRIKQAIGSETAQIAIAKNNNPSGVLTAPAPPSWPKSKQRAAKPITIITVRPSPLALPPGTITHPLSLKPSTPETADASTSSSLVKPPAIATRPQNNTDSVAASNKQATFDTQQSTPPQPNVTSDSRIPNKTEAPKSDQWSPAQIASAAASCKTILASINAAATPLLPMKRGRCGDPAPIRLSSIGANPTIQISPPAIVNCAYAAALHRWVTTKLQPAAKRLLGSPITRLSTMASYACRNRYGRKNGKLSEHAKANALDIGNFKTASGKTISVLKSWGATESQIAQAAAVKAQALRSRALATAKTRTKTASVSAQDIVNKTSLQTSKQVVTAQPTPPPSKFKRGHLRGKNDISASPETRFLHKVHASACGIFGTVLGPEANKAHANHFHFDGMKRRRKAFCE